MFNVILSILTVFLLSACMGGGGGSATGDLGVPGGGQAQPINQEVSEVAPGTPVGDCTTDPNSSPDCKAQQHGLTTPEPPPPPPPDDLTY